MSSNPYQQALTELSTIRDVLRYAITKMNQADLFYGHGTDNAWDDALALIFDTLHLSHEQQKILLDARLTTDEKKSLADLLLKRIDKRIPTSYLTKTAWFADLPFYVDERVIIPRSPFAELIETEFSPWIAPENVNRILDLCTGSACIAIASAYYMPDAIVDAVDISEEALAVAEINIKKFDMGEQVYLIQSNLFENLLERQYDIIISNPPYVDKQDMDNLPEEFRHEPELALASGDDGLEATTTILKQASRYLSDNGILVVEVGNSQHALMEKYPEVPFLWLDFARGGEGVFLLTKQQLQQHNF